ncbi:probable C-mannosyltransferase DPY19L2 isoform X1 [Macaca thibetana thibetana]|uniref:probable C-mannosyltransferase DPY19L2 isoform X1 n=1 Tax=Macaca thibetana thibetana TaxID=257877 RepID=UPI0021BC8340|nr:probable C-mannosyltransferase DPY19L2 isoform X1 [Macaca thibetana thibetana]
MERTSSNDRSPFVALCLSNVAFMLPWQFAQFILFTQLIQGSAWWFGTIILKFLTSKILDVSDHRLSAFFKVSRQVIGRVNHKVLQIRLGGLTAARILRPGCSMLEIWDVEDPSNAANPPLCSVLLKDARPYFTTVFQNSVYRVLKVN